MDMSLARFARKQVVTADASETVRQVAGKMLDGHVGAVVILENRRPVGIVTDRDLALRVIATARPPDTEVREVMSQDLVTARVDEGLDEVVFRMRRSGVRRLPLLDRGGVLVGLVSLDDLHVLLAKELSTTAEVVMDNRGP
jgi:CBS domain-containing protein